MLESDIEHEKGGDRTAGVSGNVVSARCLCNKKKGVGGRHEERQGGGQGK